MNFKDNDGNQTQNRHQAAISSAEHFDIVENVVIEESNVNNDDDNTEDFALDDSDGCDRNEPEVNVKDSIKELIAAKKYEIVDDINGSAHKKKQGPSVWSVFARIKNRETNELISYTFCKHCEELLSYNLQHYTTSLMARHSCYKTFKEGYFQHQNSDSLLQRQHTVTPRRLVFSTNSAKSTKRTTPSQSNTDDQITNDIRNLFQEHKTNVKKEVTNSIVKWVTKDIRPFDVVSSEYFIALAQTFIDVGAKYGSISASQIVPSDTTVSAYVDKLYNQTKEKINPEILEAISSGIYASS